MSYKSSFNGISDNELLEYILVVPELKNNLYVQWRLNKINKLKEETINHI
jgi:hypothetical protein